jgi:hypothetical protein
MTTTQDRVREFADYGQRNVTDAVNSAFELTEKLFASQRELAAGLFTAGTDFAEATRAASEKAFSAGTAAARDAVRRNEEAVRAATDRVTADQA